MRTMIILLLLALGIPAAARADLSPRTERIASTDRAVVDAHIFDTAPAGRPRAAVVFAHGGGWVAGDATWVYPRAQRFAELGMVAVALDYHLNDPRAATADVQAAVRWLRAHAAELNIDSTRILAYGVSAGGQLVVSAAESDDPGARPNALVLLSPAVDVEHDDWFAHLVGADHVREFSPLVNIGPNMPPTLILQGDVDHQTPLAGARRFCDAMRAHHIRCVLQIYRGYGHLFTPAGIDDRENPRPDPAISKRAATSAEAFLRREGYLR